MGNVGSRVEEGFPVVIRDQNRLSVTSVKITNSRNRVLCTIVPHGFPVTRYIVKKEADDDSVVEYIQDPESLPPSAPSFLLRLNNDEDIFFYFTFTMRQPRPTSSNPDMAPTVSASTLDTIINSLTFVFAPTSKDLDNLVTREFNADPNLHKNPNVELVGDYTTAGSSVEQFEWSWKWRPPKMEKDRGGGWRSSCSFVEYDSRAHRLNTLVSFSFWVHNSRVFGSPKSPSPRMELKVPPRLRIASAQSVESRISDSDNDPVTFREPPSPIEAIPEYGLSHEPSIAVNPVKVDINCQRPGEDISAVEDGPLFRATMKALEQKTGNMRTKMKKVLRKAEAAREAQIACNASVVAFMEALREASSSNANAVQPALDHYFEKIATEILSYEKQNAINLQKLIIDPMSKLYSNEIKQVDSKKKDFDDESRDFYAYVGRYLGQRQDSLKEKKRVESDSKYEVKRRNFELKRFDYSSFMQDLHGGRKDQEVLSQLTKYAETQAKGYLSTAKKIEALIPQLEALCFEVRETDKEYQLLRTGREEKRRALEKSSKSHADGDAAVQSLLSLGTPTLKSGSDFGQMNGLTPPINVRERPRSVGPSTAINFGTPIGAPDSGLSVSPFGHSLLSVSPSQNKFKGIRDLEERDRSASGNLAGGDTQHRKEGLLWSMSRPGSYIDPKGLNKQAWHKFWIVLDQGKLSEYINWKQNLEPHMDPIDLRMASVREARNAERRFCFEVITPNFTRVYQAPSEDDMKAWIQAINNALQTAFEGGRGGNPLPPSDAHNPAAGKPSSSIARDLFGKSTSLHNHSHRSLSTSTAHLTAKNIARHATVGDRPPISRSRSSEERTGRLLQTIRDADAGNAWCADCSSDARVEWVSINLGIIVCIECSGIHRSLGTHISKIRSLTLDTVSFTQDIVELLLLVGNRVSNMIWEATLHDSPANAGTKPSPSSTRDHRLRFITAKYGERAFVSRPAASSPTSPPSTSASAASAASTGGSGLARPSSSPPDDMLLTSVKRNDIRNVLYALAVHANPNTTDRSRATHAVFLALAAADPAVPSQVQQQPQQQQQNHYPIPSSSSSSFNHPTPPSTTTSNPRKSFPIAELLLQNGAELPAQLPPILLSPSARAYLEFKREQKLGIIGKGGRVGHYGGGGGGGEFAVGSAPSASSSAADGVVPLGGMMQAGSGGGGSGGGLGIAGGGGGGSGFSGPMRRGLSEARGGR